MYRIIRNFEGGITYTIYSLCKMTLPGYVVKGDWYQFVRNFDDDTPLYLCLYDKVISFDVYEIKKSTVYEIMRTGRLNFWGLHNDAWCSGGWYNILIKEKWGKSDMTCVKMKCEILDGDLYIPKDCRPSDYNVKEQSWDDYLLKENGYVINWDKKKYRDIILSELI